jgi:hypothetical protein
VIDTLTVADAQGPTNRTTDRLEDRTKRPPEGKAEGEDQQDDAASSAGRTVGGLALLALAALAVISIFLIKPESLAFTVLVVALASLLTGLSSVVLPLKLRSRSVPFVVVAAGTAGLLAAVLAIPRDSSPESSSPTETTGQASPSTSPPPSEGDPFTWDLDLKFGGCEGLIVSNSLLESLPERDELTAEWAYKNGGASANNIVTLTVQGNSEDAVVLKGIHIVDLELAPAPSDVSAIVPCAGGGGHLDRRYYELVLDKPPKLTARPGRSEDDEITEPVKDFPFKVSRSDPEYFEFDIAAGPSCLCSWKIGLDWTSRGRSGTTIIDRKFSSIRNVVSDAAVSSHYLQNDGTWYPPLSE